MLGNALEWYDYALYAQFSRIIAKHFFPLDGNEFLSMLATLGLFAAGFIMRPLGGVIFGIIGDRYGRKTALSIAILLMALPTACIGALPTYEQIGIIAPIILTIIRLLQGVALGGEFSGCIAFLVEHSPADQRGLMGSASFVSMCAGMLIGALTATFACRMLSAEDLSSWGWRIPFLISIIFGMIGFHIRMHLEESPIYSYAKEHGIISENPVKETFTEHKGELINAIGLYLMVTVPFYVITMFVGTYVQGLGHQLKDALIINCTSLTTLILVMPISAYISDKVGRKPVLTFATVSIALLSYPVFWLLNQPGMVMPLISQILFAIIVGIFMGPVPTTLVELFPTKIRFTGVALSYNISAALFGGTAPSVLYWLTKHYPTTNIIAYYVIFFSIITLISLKYFKESYKKSLLE